MIIDNIKNAHLYSLNDRFTKAFEYLKNTDLSTLPTGKHDIDGDDVFAICLEYETKTEAECKLEAHYKYIDLQYIVSGEEYMGLAQLDGQTPVVVNKEHDYAFYESATSLMKFQPEMFAVFYPDDLHMTSIQVDQPQSLKKIVVKVKL